MCKYRRRLLECLDETLIVVHHEEILKKGFSDLLKADMRDDLSRLYSLFKTSEGKSLMCDHYNKYNKVRFNYLVQFLQITVMFFNLNLCICFLRSEKVVKD